MKKIIFFLITSALLLPVVAFAQPTVESMAETFASKVVVVGGWIVVIMWVFTGVLFLTSSGDPGKLKSAQMSLFAAIGGTVLIILAAGGPRLLAFVGNLFGL